MEIYIKVIEQSNNQNPDVQQMLALLREVQNKIANISGEMGVFLDAIEEKATSISNKRLDMTENDALSDEEKGFLGCIEEDTEDIEKSVEVVRECLRKIEKAVCSITGDC